VFFAWAVEWRTLLVQGPLGTCPISGGASAPPLSAASTFGALLSFFVSIKSRNSTEQRAEHIFTSEILRSASLHVMYLRAVHAEFDIPTLRKFIRDNPLGTLITAFQSKTFPSIQCTHLPWLLDVTDEGSDTELGNLRGHFAKANPHCQAIVEDVQTRGPSNGSLEQEVCVLFNGPIHSYVTPKFYVETKPKTGKVVPTWNYSAVQAYGKATFYFDTKNPDTISFLQK
jgi:predicted FMN-binding regulatory protein PaiB